MEYLFTPLQFIIGESCFRGINFLTLLACSAAVARIKLSGQISEQSARYVEVNATEWYWQPSTVSATLSTGRINEGTRAHKHAYIDPLLLLAHCVLLEHTCAFSFFYLGLFSQPLKLPSCNFSVLEHVYNISQFSLIFKFN